MGDIRKNENEFLDTDLFASGPPNRDLYEGTFPVEEPMPEEECADRSERRKAIENGAELEQPTQTISVSMGPIRCGDCGQEVAAYGRHHCPAIYESVRRRRGGGPMGV